VVAPALGAAACGVALDDEELGLLDVVGGAVRKLVRHAAGVERALALDELTRLAGGLARLGGEHRALADALRLPSGAPRATPSFSPTTPETKPSTSALRSFSLVWLLNCGFGSFTETIAVRPSRRSSPDGVRSLSRPFCLA
jgi:hypothetical protein